MANIKLERGAKYRLNYAAYRNPFAGLKIGSAKPIEAAMPVTLAEPGVFNGWRRKLRKGDVLTYCGTSAGSDPGIEEIFEASDGQRGAFDPAGIWGGVNEVMLTKMESV